MSTEEEESRRVRLEVRGRVGFKELGRDFGVGSLSRQSGELLRSAFSMRGFFVGGARPSAGSSGACRTERSEDRDRGAIVEEDQFIVWLDFPKVLQGLGDEIAEKFLADMEVKVMNSARHHLLFYASIHSQCFVFVFYCSILT